MNHLTVVPENYDSDGDSETTSNAPQTRHKVVLYIPTGIEARLRDHVMARLADVYGGFTLTEAHGGWLDDSGNLVEERVMRVESVRMDDEAPKAEVIAESTAEWLKSHSNEDAIMWEVADVKAEMS